MKPIIKILLIAIITTSFMHASTKYYQCDEQMIVQANGKTSLFKNNPTYHALIDKKRVIIKLTDDIMFTLDYIQHGTSSDGVPYNLYGKKSGNIFAAIYDNFKRGVKVMNVKNDSEVIITNCKLLEEEK